MGWSWNKKNLTVAISGVLATVVFGVLAWISAESDTPGGNSQTQQGGSHNQQAQGGGQIADTINNANIFADAAKDQGREEILQEAEKYKDVMPPGGDVAPYLIVAPGNLYVRDSPTKDGKRVGAAWHKTLVYAGCAAQSDFDPILDDDVKAVWIKIRWPNLDPGDDMRAGQPSDPLQGWAYSGRLVPAGHNGKIRSC